MLAYVLNKNIDGQIILRDIQKFIESRLKDAQQQLVLVIDIKEISQDSVDHIPKIEHKPS